ncbi:hypothetical protein EPN87_01770 [archaeon]|nr:MAG: hypothetical protein EPN87_01770 [archaeon]
MVFQKVARVSDIPEGHMKGYTVGNEDLVIARIGGRFYCIDGICSHEESRLADGTLEGKIVTCPLHQAQFDMTTGKVSKDTPWATDLREFAVKVDGEDLLVDV